MKIAVGSTRAAKLAAVRLSLARIGAVVPSWNDAEIVARAVEGVAPAMPLTDAELMRGAWARARAVHDALRAEGSRTDFYVGMEGGFHTTTFDGVTHTFLRGWVCVSDGGREAFGVTPSVCVPASVARRVIDENRELGAVIDEVAGESDVRSRQGAWGVLTLDLITRAASFETALVAAFAPFYNAGLYPEVPGER